MRNIVKSNELGLMRTSPKMADQLSANGKKRIEDKVYYILGLSDFSFFFLYSFLSLFGFPDGHSRWAICISHKRRKIEFASTFPISIGQWNYLENEIITAVTLCVAGQIPGQGAPVKKNNKKSTKPGNQRHDFSRTNPPVFDSRPSRHIFFYHVLSLCPRSCVKKQIQEKTVTHNRARCRFLSSILPAWFKSFRFPSLFQAVVYSHFIHSSLFFFI